jgi:hypothetical protein
MTAVFYTPPGGSGDVGGQAMRNIVMLSNVMVIGAILASIGSTYMFWGEETLHAMQIVGAIILYIAPVWVPPLLGGREVSVVGNAAMGGISRGGELFGIIAVLGLVIEIALRISARARQGAKADLLKYGKGIKEERNQKNVFMGKCWQLPYCRTFVRERCPIYHSRRTCWREKVGCMCEEEVIRNAMENRPIPKDLVGASKYIPVNNKLTQGQKRQRCRQCVIYNEHLKHKYRLSLPLTVLGFGIFYLIARQPLLGISSGMIAKLDSAMGALTYGQAVSVKNNAAFQEILLDCAMIAILAYVLKGLEYLIFKLKV